MLGSKAKSKPSFALHDGFRSMKAKFSRLILVGKKLVQMFLGLFLQIVAPYLFFFGIIIPAILTGIAYGMLAVWTDRSRKEISKESLKIILAIVFVLAALISCGSVINIYREYPIMLD